MNKNENFYITIVPDPEILIVFSGSGRGFPHSLPKDFSLLDLKLIQAEQVHGTGVGVVKGNGDDYFIGMDALVTSTIGNALFIRTADCVPILLYDQVSKAVAAVHSGLSGTLGSIAWHTIDKMISEYSSSPGNIRAYIGPSIHKCCYEVDEPVISKIKQLSFYHQIVDKVGNGKYMLDLQSFNRNLLLEKGVLTENIIDIGLCTGCRADLFYSYRKRKDSERMYSMILRKGQV